MPNTIQTKRRLSVTGIQNITLQPGEMLWQEYDNQLLIKRADGSVIPIGGAGGIGVDGFVTTANTPQTIAGTKTVSGELNITGALKIAGTAITSDANELNKLDGFNGTSTDLNRLAGVIPGTASLEKAVVLGSDGQLNFGSVQLSSTAVPTADAHIANKKYVDGVAQGLDVKASATVATATALPTSTYNNGTAGESATLTADADGALVVDGQAVSVSQSVVVKNQADPIQNGIYTVTSAGSPSSTWILTRRTDADSNATISKLTSGSFIFVESGTTNASTGWVVSTQGAITVGTTQITFTQFSSAGLADAGNGLEKVGTTFSVKTASSSRITVGTAGVDLATSGATAGSNQILFSVDTYGRVTSASNSIPASAGVSIDCGVID